MARGSFKGLYTFEEVARIYGMDSSNLRKMVQHNKFKDNEIKKFGKTWIITEQAIENHFGLVMLQLHKRELKLQELQKLRENKIKSKIKTKKKAIDDLSNINFDDDIQELEEIIVDPKSVKCSFSFSDK